MFSVSIVVLLAAALAVHEPVRAVGLNGFGPTAIAGSAAYESSGPPPPALSGPAGIAPPSRP